MKIGKRWKLPCSFLGKAKLEPHQSLGFDKFVQLTFYTSSVLKSPSTFVGKGDLEEELIFPVVLSCPLYHALFVCDSVELLVRKPWPDNQNLCTYCWHFNQDLDTQDLSQNQLYWLSLHTQTSSLSLMCCVFALWGQKYKNVTFDPHFSSFQQEKAISECEDPKRNVWKVIEWTPCLPHSKETNQFLWLQARCDSIPSCFHCENATNLWQSSCQCNTLVLMSLALLAVISCFCPHICGGQGCNSRFPLSWQWPADSLVLRLNGKRFKLEPGAVDVQGLGDPDAFAMVRRRVACPWDIIIAAVRA